MSGAATSRARTASGKAARREVILRAAERLFADKGDALPTVAEVATGAGLAKGTVYLYFGSQAEVFLALLLEGWSAVLTRVADAADSAAPDPGRIVATLADAIGKRTGLLKLDSFGAVLEKQVDPEALVSFKATLAARIMEAAHCVEQTLDLPAGGAERLLINSYSFARGLWQTSGATGLRPPVENNPAHALLHPGFAAELERALLAYWRGEMGSEHGAGN